MNKKFLLIPLCLFIFFSCDDNKLDVDVTKVNAPEINILRLEQDLFALKHNNFESQTQTIRNKYGIVYEHYLMNPFRLNGSRDSSYKQEILRFINDRDVREAYNSSQKLYSDFSAFNTDFIEMVKRFKFHFPERKLPLKFITCLTGWNYAVAYMDSAIIVGLDMYLGDTCQLYQMLRYPQYQTRKMNGAHLMPDVARGWLLTEFDSSKPENTLLNHTIFYGKLFYAVNALLPNTADSLLIGYTDKQIKNCKQFEKQYWSYFAEKNRLYENDLTIIRELTSEGPFTAAISKDCPPRIAMWVGWQIVKSYMKNNEKVTLSQLMADNDAQKILNKSKYRP